MFLEIGKKITFNNLVERFVATLQNDPQNPAYERSLFYVLNAIRRGGFFYSDEEFTVVFAKSYDKPKTLSLVFFNKAEFFEKTFVHLAKDKRLRAKDFFVHHLFKPTIERLKEEFPHSIVLDEYAVEKIKAYPSENTFPQVIYDLTFLPKFKNSNFNKKKHLLNLLEKSQGKLKQSVLGYVNLTTKVLNEPEAITVVITHRLSSSVKTFIFYVFNTVLKNWLSAKEIDSKQKRYYVEPIKNLFSLLTDATILSRTESNVIFRAYFDINLEKGGLWIGEFIPSKSLLIPHIILTDYYYKNQYAYLLWDMISYSYTKNFQNINVGGSENQNLFDIKKMPDHLLNNRLAERKLYTLYIPHIR